MVILGESPVFVLRLSITVGYDSPDLFCCGLPESGDLFMYRDSENESFNFILGDFHNGGVKYCLKRS
jgi:hypothetical protein